MSVVTYNGVTLPYGMTSSFDQESVYDESDTDWHLTKYDVRVQCLVNANYVSLLAPDLANASFSSAAELMGVVRARLMTPRRTLSLKFNGTEYVPAKAGNVAGTVDARNGPKPQSCRFLQLSNATFVLQFHVVAHYWENAKVAAGADPKLTNKRGNPVLYNRWTESQEIDGCGYTRRRREGKYAIRSDNFEGLTVDELRSDMAVVGVPQGFLREAATYVVDPSGLALAYSVVDKEVFKMPPPPAFEAAGSFTQTLARFAVARYGEVRVHLKGGKTTRQDDLCAAALLVASKKLRTAGALVNDQTGRFTMIMGGQLTMGLYDNTVDLSLAVRMKPGLFTKPGGTRRRFNGVWGLDFDTSTPGSDPGENTGYQPLYFDRGSASLLLQAAAYWDPSLQNTVLNEQTGQFPVGLEPGQAGRFPEG